MTDEELADEDCYCQQCGQPVHCFEALCEDCRWGVSDDGQDATPPEEGAALTDEELAALRAECDGMAEALCGPDGGWSRQIDGWYALDLSSERVRALHALLAEVTALRATLGEQHEANARLTIENTRLLEQAQRLIDQHGTFPPMGYKLDLKGL